MRATLHAPISTLAIWAAVLVAAACACSAQNGPSTQKPAARTPAPGLYSIAGRVVNATTGEPVRRANVAALAEQGSQIVEMTLTDADGNFSLQNLPPGKYPLTASRRGYRTAFYDEHEEYNSAIVTGPDQDTTHLVFRLMPGGVIRGVVTADGGEPVENASVILFKRDRASSSADGSEEIRQADGAMTDDTGAYEFSNLSAGEYYVAVSTSPWYAIRQPSRRNADDGESPLDVAYPVTFFDSTTEEGSATPVTIEAGSRQQADISLHAVPALRLQLPVQRNRMNGMVQPELRTMIFGTQISAESGLAGDPLHTGFVEFSGVAPGRYELQQGDPPRISDIELGSSQVIDPNAGTPAVSVSGTLRTTAGAPVPESVSLALEPVNGHNQTVLPAVARKGEFRFDAVAPGTWTLSAQADGNVLPIVAVVTGGAILPGNQITVKERPLTVAAVVSPSLSRVQGFAKTDGKGISGAMIVLVPRQPSAFRALVRRDQSDSDGSFTLRDVPAGRYTVIAIQNGWNLNWTDQETIARYLPRGVAVSVSDQAGGLVKLSGSVPVQ